MHAISSYCGIRPTTTQTDNYITIHCAAAAPACSVRNWIVNTVQSNSTSVKWWSPTPLWLQFCHKGDEIMELEISTGMCWNRDGVGTGTIYFRCHSLHWPDLIYVQIHSIRQTDKWVQYTPYLRRIPEQHNAYSLLPPCTSSRGCIWCLVQLSMKHQQKQLSNNKQILNLPYSSTTWKTNSVLSTQSCLIKNLSETAWNWHCYIVITNSMTFQGFFNDELQFLNDHKQTIVWVI